MTGMAVQTIVFRTDASVQIGTGHVMRCLTLADELTARGASCRFVARPHRGHLIDLIRQRGHEVLSLPVRPSGENQVSPSNDEPAHISWLGAPWQSDAAETIATLNGEIVDWLVVDHYALDARWERALQPACRQLLVIDDLADRQHEADLLLDQNWFGAATATRYDGLLPTRCETLLGPAFALLKPEYAQLRAWLPPRNGIVRRVLVFLGGSDPSNQTGKVLGALMRPGLENLAVDVIVGVNHPDPQGIARQVAARPGTSLYQGLPSLAGLMMRADLMIGAGGATNWERMCLGLPAAVISIAENQTAASIALMKAGYIQFLGLMDEVDAEAIADALRGRLAQPELLQAQSRMGQSLVSGSGAAELSLRMLAQRGE